MSNLDQLHVTPLYLAAASAAAKSPQSCLTLCDPIDGSPPGFRQEHWSGLPFHLQCMKVKSEVAQPCPTLSDPMDCSLPGSSIHGSFQARVLEWVAIAFSLYLANCIKFEFCLLFLLLREKHGIEIIHSITTVKASFHNEKLDEFKRNYSLFLLIKMITHFK